MHTFEYMAVCLIYQWIFNIYILQSVCVCVWCVVVVVMV